MEHRDEIGQVAGRHAAPVPRADRVPAARLGVQPEGGVDDDEERRHSVVDGPASQKVAHFEALFHVLYIATPPEEAEFAESSFERVQE